MNNENKTELCDQWCIGCESFTDKLEDWNNKGYLLCENCNEKFEDKTGYCSLDCCLSGNCDQTC